MGPGAFTIQAQMPDVDNIEQNSRVRVGDVNVGTVTKIERQGWHALVTMELNGDVELPANATAKLGQTSLLGSLHIELAPPTDVPPEGRLHDGSLIPLASSEQYPSTEQTLAAVALLLNGGGIGNIQDITEAFSIAFTGRENDLRSLIEQLDKAIGYLDDQKDDIIAATREPEQPGRSVRRAEAGGGQGVTDHSRCAGGAQGSARQLVRGARAARQVQRAGRRLGQPDQGSPRSGAQRIGPVLESLANAGPALTRALSFLPDVPVSQGDSSPTGMRGDYANLSLIVDLTLSRIDQDSSPERGGSAI